MKEARHLSWEFLEQRLKSRTPSIEVIQGSPRCELAVSEEGRRLSLRIAAGVKPIEELPAFSAIECSTSGKGAKACVNVSCLDDEHFQEFYAFLMNVADRVQLHGESIPNAITHAAKALRELLAPEKTLNLDDQVGLWGELWVLDGLGKERGWKLAVESWVAKDEQPEEHDFALKSVDVEVKTTRSEQRHHHASTQTQFTPKDGRKLFLASVQITAGGSGGRSLADVIGEISAACGPAQRKLFKAKLESHGWRERDAKKYPSRWLLRSAPTLIPIEELPRIDIEGQKRSRVVSLSYVVDVGGLGKPLEESWSWLK
jgi:hypothetical protein